MEIITRVWNTNVWNYNKMKGDINGDGDDDA
jgi:hypothetical protein